MHQIQGTGQEWPHRVDLHQGQVVQLAPWRKVRVKITDGGHGKKLNKFSTFLKLTLSLPKHF